MTSPVRFLKKFLKSPTTIGSIVPSSPVLVATIMAAIDWQKVGVIVELGAGTGVVTKAINSIRSEQSVFISFEKDEQMHNDLMKRYPDIVMGSDAFHLAIELNKLGHEQVDCIVSCLPFSLFEASQQSALLASIYKVLRPGGQFIAFQYSLQLQKQIEAIYDDVDVRFVMRNIPPAFIYVCHKQVQ